MLNKKPIIFCVLALPWTACATRITIQTKPDKVAVSLPETGKALGETPVEISSGDVENGIAGGKLLKLAKSGYQSVYVWLPDSREDIDIVMNLYPFFLRSNDGRQVVSQELTGFELIALSDELLSLQYKVLSGDTSVEKQVDSILTSNPGLAAAHYLKSILLLAKNDKAKAKDFLRQAMFYEPNQVDYLSLYNEAFESGSQ